MLDEEYDEELAERQRIKQENIKKQEALRLAAIKRKKEKKKEACRTHGET